MTAAGVETPDEVELTGTGSVLFTAALANADANVDPEATDDRARELLLPLVWSVQNPELGESSPAGATAPFIKATDVADRTWCMSGTREGARGWRS